LKELLKATLPSNQDFRSMQLAYQLIQHVNARINKDKKAAEDRREVADVLGRIAKLPDGPVHSFRVVKQGELLSSSFATEKEKKGHGSRRYANKSQFFLFNDSIVRCKRAQSGRRQAPLRVQGAHSRSARRSPSRACRRRRRRLAALAPPAAPQCWLNRRQLWLPAVRRHPARRPAPPIAGGARGMRLSCSPPCTASWCAASGAANEAERAEWEAAIRSCLTPGAPSDADAEHRQLAACTHDLRGVEQRIDVVRDQIAKSRTKPQRDAAIQELRVLEAERATLVLKVRQRQRAGAARARRSVAGTTESHAGEQSHRSLAASRPRRADAHCVERTGAERSRCRPLACPPAAMAQLQDRLARDKAAGGASPSELAAQSGAWEPIKPTGLLRTNRVVGELAAQCQTSLKGHELWRAATRGERRLARHCAADCTERGGARRIAALHRVAN
jgi:hypothetical protein